VVGDLHDLVKQLLPVEVLEWTASAKCSACGSRPNEGAKFWMQVLTELGSAVCKTSSSAAWTG
jgi:hypothetical protein